VASATPTPIAKTTQPPVWPVLTGYAVVIFGTVLGTIVLTVLITVVWSLQFELTPAQVAERLRVSSAYMFTAGLVSPFLLVVVSWAICAHARVPLSKGLQLGRTRAGYGEIALLALVTVGAGWAISSAMTLGLGHEPITSKLIRESLERASAPWKAALAVMVIVIAPVTEEGFFRGCLQSKLRARWGAVPAIAVTSALFGVIHLHPAHMLMAAVIGVGLGWTAERAGGIRPAIFAHACNNALALLPTLLGIRSSSGNTINVVAMAIAVAVVGGAIWMVRRFYPLPSAVQAPQPGK
jgi:membrane protease YdiL (CAAX protease family)